jgi:hypothetical protein
MKQETFDLLVQTRLDLIKETLLVKAKEYSRNDDPLHNFNKSSEITGLTPEECLDGFLLKHYVSYRDMLKDSKEGKDINLNYIREKFGDILVYFILQEIQFLNKYSFKKETISSVLKDLGKEPFFINWKKAGETSNTTITSKKDDPITYTTDKSF